MPRGPRPSHPSVRQRTNKTSTAAELEVLAPEDRAAIDVPDLPAVGRMWDPVSCDWWRDAWQSPMRVEWDPADTTGAMVILAVTLDEFLIEAQKRAFGESPNASDLSKLAKTFRDGSARLGLDPFARRSLQWVLAQTENTEARTEATKARTRQQRAKPKRRGLDALE